MNLQAELAEARRKGYVIARGNAAGERLAGAWYRECWDRRIPYLRIMPRRLWATVLLDLDPTMQRLPDDAKRRLGHVANEFWERRGWLSYGDYTRISHVRIENAERLGLRLLGVVLLALGQWQEASGAAPEIAKGGA